MMRFFRKAMLLLVIPVLISACGNDESSLLHVTGSGYTGNFLAWTGSSDPSHYFTLVRVDGQTGSVTTVGGFNFFPALAYAPNGTLYGVSDELHIIDPVSGSTVKIGELRYQGSAPILMTGAAFSPGGQLYVLENSGDRVFTVNLLNAALTYVGTPAATISDLEFSAEGTLYAAFGSLFTLDPADMTTTVTVGGTGDYMSSLTFGAGATLFGIDAYPSMNIFSLDLGTGLATAVAAVASDNLASLVAEREIVWVAGTDLHAAAPMNGFAPSLSADAFLDKERKIREAAR